MVLLNAWNSALNLNRLQLREEDGWKSRYRGIIDNEADGHQYNVGSLALDN